MFVNAAEAAKGKAHKVAPNFAAWSRDTQETALHMLLKKSHARALGASSKSQKAILVS